MFVLMYTVVLASHVLVVSEGTFYKFQDQCERDGRQLLALVQLHQPKAKLQWDCRAKATLDG